MPSIIFPLSLVSVVIAIVAIGSLSQGSRYAVWAAQRLIIRLIIAVSPGYQMSAWERSIIRGKGWTAGSSSPDGAGGGVIPGGGAVGSKPGVGGGR